VQVPMCTGGTLAHAGLPVRCAYISSTELWPSIHVSSSFGHLQQCPHTQCAPGLHPHYSAQPPAQLAVSQSVDLGQNNNPNTTPTKDYEIVRVVVYLRGVQRGCAEEGERGSTPTE